MVSLSGFKKKIVFSSGAGYGSAPDLSDPSWEIACVRGPGTAGLLNLDPSKAVTDGAVLLSDFFEPESAIQKRGTVFVPHIRTHWRIGSTLKKVCDRIGFGYLPPDAQMAHFVETLRDADLAVCEAMHGAITADAVRTPWVCCDLLYHNEFKWRDWCASMDVPYLRHPIGASVEWRNGSLVYRGLRKVKGPLERVRLEHQLGKLEFFPRNLSNLEIFKERKQRLKQLVEDINEHYG